MCSKPSCLGDPWCSEWGCCESYSDENFKEPPSSSVEMETVYKGFVPKNTKKATNWSSRVFEEWRAQRNEAVIECQSQSVRQIDNSELCPSNLLQCPTATSLNYWLSRFVVEVRRCNWPSVQRTATL